MKLKKGWGFTLLEVLIVITLIGILSSISWYVGKIRPAQARDATRKSDLQNIANALDGYYVVNNLQYPPKYYPPPGSLPPFITGCSSSACWGDSSKNPGGTHWIADLTTDDIKIMPRDPKQAKGWCPYYYRRTFGNFETSNKRSFILWACLENTSDEHIYNKPTATCTVSLNRPTDYNGITYNYCQTSFAKYP